MMKRGFEGSSGVLGEDRVRERRGKAFVWGSDRRVLRELSLL